VPLVDVLLARGPRGDEAWRFQTCKGSPLDLGTGWP
jgi:hypothetical protein